MGTDPFEGWSDKEIKEYFFNRENPYYGMYDTGYGDYLDDSSSSPSPSTPSNVPTYSVPTLQEQDSALEKFLKGVFGSILLIIVFFVLARLGVLYLSYVLTIGR